jgi:hypothetical protein
MTPVQGDLLKPRWRANDLIQDISGAALDVEIERFGAGADQ